MPYLEHPTVEKMNRDGFLGTTEQDSSVETCKSCDASLKRGESVVEFQDHVFCDTECLTEAFCDDPKAFGMETTRLS